MFLGGAEAPLSGERIFPQKHLENRYRRFRKPTFPSIVFVPPLFSRLPPPPPPCLHDRRPSVFSLRNNVCLSPGSRPSTVLGASIEIPFINRFQLAFSHPKYIAYAVPWKACMVHGQTRIVALRPCELGLSTCSARCGTKLPEYLK